MSFAKELIEKSKIELLKHKDKRTKPVTLKELGDELNYFGNSIRYSYITDKEFHRRKKKRLVVKTSRRKNRNK